MLLHPDAFCTATKATLGEAMRFLSSLLVSTMFFAAIGLKGVATAAPPNFAQASPAEIRSYVEQMLNGVPMAAMENTAAAAASAIERRISAERGASERASLLLSYAIALDFLAGDDVQWARAKAALDQALQILGKERSPEEWARAQLALAELYYSKAVDAAGAEETQRRAEAAVAAATSVYTLDAKPRRYLEARCLQLQNIVNTADYSDAELPDPRTAGRRAAMVLCTQGRCGRADHAELGRLQDQMGLAGLA